MNVQPFRPAKPRRPGAPLALLALGALTGLAFTIFVIKQARRSFAEYKTLRGILLSLLAVALAVVLLCGTAFLFLAITIRLGP